MQEKVNEDFIYRFNAFDIEEETKSGTLDFDKTFEAAVTTALTDKGKKLSENGWKMHDYDVDHFKKGCIGWYMRMGDALDLDRSEIAKIIEYEIESMKY